MNILEDVLREDKKFLVPFLVGGYPNLERFKEDIIGCYNSGGDIIEVGIPYNEALADGEVIRDAYFKVIENKVGIREILSTLNEIKYLKIPIVIMSYFNPIYCYGLEKFIKDINRVGISGLLIPDLPLEERAPITKICENENISLIPLVSRASKDRVSKITKGTRSFVYAVSVNGTTGVRGGYDLGIKEYLKFVKETSKAKTFLGFGISGRESVEKVKIFCDGVIVGSAIINKINKKEDINEFVKELKTSLLK